MANNSTTGSIKTNSDSLINVFDNNNNETINKNSNPNRNSYGSSIDLGLQNDSKTSDDTDGAYQDPMSRMTKEEYLESIFGPALNLSNQNLTLVEKIRKVLLSGYFHVFIIVLVLLDSFCVTVELVIDLESNEENHSMRTVEEVFKYIGLAILTFFVVELGFKLIFIRHEFLKSKLEIFDAVIVVISFILDVVFIDKKSAVATLGSIFVLFRFWRIIRIVNGIIVTVEKRAEAKIEKLKAGMNSLIKEIDALKTELSKKQLKIDELKKIKE